MTYRGRAARRRELRQRDFQKRLDAELLKRPPRVEHHVVAGPAHAFEVGERVERRGLSLENAAKPEFVLRLGKAPSQQRVVVSLQSSIPGRRLWVGGDDIPLEEARLHHGVFRAVRMRCTVDVFGAKNHVEWFTWEPEAGVANAPYRAVRQARAYLDHGATEMRELAERIQRVEHMSTRDAITETFSLLLELRYRFERVAELFDVVISAADEWLAQPPKEADPRGHWRTARRHTPTEIDL